MGVFDGAKDWLLKVALKKAIKRVLPGILGLVLVFVKKANGVVGDAGLSISVDDAALASFIAGLVTVIQNYIKVKFGVEWL